VNYAALSAALSEQSAMHKIRNTYTICLKCNLKIKNLFIVPVDIRENSTIPVELYTWQFSIPFKYYRQEKSTFVNLQCPKIPKFFGLTRGLLGD